MLIKKVFGTAGARVLNAVIAFAVLIISTHLFGADGYGVITMVVLSIMFINMFNDLIGGGALVYLIPRNRLSELLLISWIWSLFTAAAGAGVLLLFDDPLVAPYAWHVFLLSALRNLFTINQKVLLGKEKIAAFNVFSVVQILVVLLSLLLLRFFSDDAQVIHYLYAMYASFGISFLLSSYFVIPHLKTEEFRISFAVIRRAVSLGFFTQIANITQFLNYRLTYYFIQTFWSSATGTAAPLGIYGSTNKLVEGNWLISKSLSLVQYSVLSNKDEESYAQRLTLSFFKISVLITTFITLILVLLPAEFYNWLFGGQAFEQIPVLILALAPGIVAISMSNIIAHYFAGKGLQRINAIGSVIGFAATVVAGLLLVPEYGLQGAAYTSSIAHSLAAVYMLLIFLNKTQLSVRHLLINKVDIDLFKGMLKRFRKNENNNTTETQKQKD